MSIFKKANFLVVIIVFVVILLTSFSAYQNNKNYDSVNNLNSIEKYDEGNVYTLTDEAIRVALENGISVDEVNLVNYYARRTDVSAKELLDLLISGKSLEEIEKEIVVKDDEWRTKEFKGKGPYIVMETTNDKRRSLDKTGYCLLDFYKIDANMTEGQLTKILHGRLPNSYCVPYNGGLDYVYKLSDGGEIYVVFGPPSVATTRTRSVQVIYYFPNGNNKRSSRRYIISEGEDDDIIEWVLESKELICADNDNKDVELSDEADPNDYRCNEAVLKKFLKKGLQLNEINALSCIACWLDVEVESVIGDYLADKDAFLDNIEDNLKDKVVQSSYLRLSEFIPIEYQMSEWQVTKLLLGHIPSRISYGENNSKVETYLLYNGGSVDIGYRTSDTNLRENIVNTVVYYPNRDGLEQSERYVLVDKNSKNEYGMIVFGNSKP